MIATILLIALQEKGYTETLPKHLVEFKMAAIPGGEVKIGDKKVEVKPFYLATTEATWELYDAFLLSGEPSRPYDQTQFAADVIARPSRSYILPDLGWGHQGYPVINVSHLNVEMFVRWLRTTTKKNYRLPTEAEWQWAAQGGKGDSWKPTRAELDKSDWHKGNADETTQPVGKTVANAYGLFDLFGNTGEWVLDLAGKPVIAGGDYDFDAAKMAPTTRRYYHPDWQKTDPQLPKSRWWYSDGSMCGFRLACDK